MIAFISLYQPENMNHGAETKLNLPPAPHRPVPAMQCYLAYGAALLVGAVAWWVLQSRGLIEDPFSVGLAVTCISTVVIWVFSVANDNSSIYDPYWVIAPPILALALKATAGGGLLGDWSARQICVVACLWIWGIRYHTMYSWSGWRSGLVHEDWRYEEMRSAPRPLLAQLAHRDAPLPDCARVLRVRAGGAGTDC